MRVNEERRRVIVSVGIAFIVAPGLRSIGRYERELGTRRRVGTASCQGRRWLERRERPVDDDFRSAVVVRIGFLLDRGRSHRCVVAQGAPACRDVRARLGLRLR